MCVCVYGQCKVAVYGDERCYSLFARLSVYGRMESFPESSGRLLREFQLQLGHRPLLITAERLLQITAVNMFSVDNAVPAGD